eukprot:tig00000821_g4477.t1
MSVALAWSRSTTPACIADLPDELLEAVLLFLGQRDRYLAAAVSRRFAVASYSPNCWKSLQLHVGYTHVRANELPVVTPENAPALLQQPRFSQLQELSIVAVGRGVKLASLLAAAPPSVERLKISYLESVEPSPAASQQPGGPGPGALDLEGVSLRALPALRALSLRFLDPGSPPGEARFVYAAEALAAAGPAPRLEELALDAPLVAVGEGAPFAPLRAAFPALRTLRAACVSWGGPGPLRALLEAGLVPERLVLHRVHDEACAADAPSPASPPPAAAPSPSGRPARRPPSGAHAASLERLRLGEGHSSRGARAPARRLAALPRLRALSFAPRPPPRPARRVAGRRPACE